MSDLHRVTNHRPRTNNSWWSILFQVFHHHSLTPFFFGPAQISDSLTFVGTSTGIKKCTEWMEWFNMIMKTSKVNKQRLNFSCSSPVSFFGGPFFGKETEAFVASESNSSGNVNKAINLEDRESNAFSKPCIERKSISAICLARIPDSCVRLTEQRMSISTGL